jgi:quinoprotein glucose dehydrogenase
MANKAAMRCIGEIVPYGCDFPERTPCDRTVTLKDRYTVAMKRAILAALCIAACYAFQSVPDGDWPAYGRDAGGQRFSPLSEIDRSNVQLLKPAWTFHTGDAYEPPRGRPTAFEATPIYVEGTVYLGTPLGRVIALDPVTGAARWSYDAKVPRNEGYGDFANRGVSTWKPANGPRRIYIATIDARLIALDAASGKPVAGFGDNGTVNLRNGLRIPARTFSDYEQTSPPAIVGNTIVVGSGVADNGSVNQPSGEVRGYNAATGKLKWTWHPMSGANAPGAANTWSVIAADPARGLVFLPTSSPSPDYYGGERLGDNLYANSIVALKAETGERVWHFQTVHHDLWDYDIASPPILFDVHRGGRTIPAVATGPKSGNYFILDRTTGKPIFGVEERPVPQSDVPGEKSSPTQPFPLAPPPLAPQKFTADQAFGASDTDRKWCSDEIAKLRNEGVFTPPSLKGTLVVPGNIGGMAWGGAAFDEAHHLLIVPTNNLAAEVRLIPRADFEKERQAGRGSDWEFSPQAGTPYGMARRFLRAPGGSLCSQPPWGTLHAIDADTAEVKWSVPLGRVPGAPASLGSLALGGPIVTAGGLVFMAGTLDSAIRAFDVETGKELWKGELPTSARSTPMTFRGPDGKQYVLVAAGGHGVAGFGALGDSLVAFRLQ